MTYNVEFPPNISPFLQQQTQPSDVATNNLTLAPQAPFASATGTHRTPGSLLVNLAAPTNGGTTDASFQVNRAGVLLGAIGTYPLTSTLGTLYLGNAAPSALNFVLSNDNTSIFETVLNSGSSNLQLWLGGAGSSGINIASGSITLFQPLLEFGVLITAPTITQITQTSDSPPANLTIAPQAPFASATGTNRNPGSLFVNIASPISGGAHSYLQVQEAGVPQVYIGNVPAFGAGGIFVTTPSATGVNVALAGGGVSTYLNVASGGTLHFSANTLDLATMTASLTTLFMPTVEWSDGIASPTLTQLTRTADLAPQNLTIAPQAPFATATGANRTPGSLIANIATPTNGGTTQGMFKVSIAGTAIAGITNYPGITADAVIYLGASALATPTASNFAVFSDGSTQTNFNAPSGGTWFATIGSSGYMELTTAALALLTPILYFTYLVANPSISQGIQQVDAPTNTFTIAAQSAQTSAVTNLTGGNLFLNPGAGATTNGTPGNTIVNIPAPTGTGVDGFFKVERNGTQLCAIGTYAAVPTFGALWLGNAAPSSTNFVLTCDTTSSNETIVNGFNNLQLILGGLGSTGINIFSTSIQFFNPLQFGELLTAPSLSQITLTTDSPAANLTVHAQNAEPAAVTNRTGGNLILQGGAGATTNGTPGNVIANMPAPTGTGTEAQLIVQRSSVNQWAFGQQIGNTTQSAIWGHITTPTSSNYILWTDGASFAELNSPGSTLYLAIGTGAIETITATGIQLFSATTSFGSGNGVLGITNATTDPTANPTGGGILYSSGGAGKWRGSSGTITTFGPADLEGFGGHCPSCGTDFAVEWQNEKYGLLTVCMNCLSNELGERPWIKRRSM